MTAVRLPRVALFCVAALAGGATMVVELAAVRLLAPWFGTSMAVWTNVIGVVLLALAIGYLLGARLCQRASPERALGLVLLGAAACAAWLPFATPWTARLFLPAGLGLDAVAGLLRWGSLAAALVLFLPPALLLGCVAPLCTELLDRDLARGAGAAGGRVLCASTLGSLAGTFATSYALVPLAGLTRTFGAAGALLAVLGCAVLLGTRGARTSVLALVPLAALTLGEMPRPEPTDAGRVLEARESPYQSVRVVAFGSGANERRQLQVNEAFDSFQSVWRPEPGPIGDGCYYDVFALPAWWAERRDAWRLCVLGLGAGTTWRVLEGALPPGVALDAFGVELDPIVVELGARWMDLADGPRRRILSGWDARAALAHESAEFDEIVVDAYANQVEIPAHLCTREFFELVGSRLAGGGFACANVGAFGLHDPVVEAVAASMCAGLGTSVLALRVPFSRNVVLVARKGAALPDALEPRFVPADERLGALARQLAFSGARRRFDPGSAPVLEDDRCDIERLQQLSLERAHAAWNAAGSGR